MFFVDTMETAGLGNRSYPASGQQAAVVVDPPRDIDRVITAAARRGVRIALVAKTHLHNDHVTGGLEPSRVTGARLAAVLGARDGQRLAARVSTAALQRVFGAVPLAVAVFMLVDAAA